MADPGDSREASLPDESERSAEILNPASRATFSEDEAAPRVRGIQEFRCTSELHAGPLPHPAIIQELARIYPNAPKIIFEDFHAQSKHRRELEKSVVGHNITLGERAQIIGGALGVVGLLGSFVVIALGHDWAGVAVATGCVLGLVSTFVIGRQSQKQELAEKEEIRRRIRDRDPVSDVDQARASERGRQAPGPHDADSEI